LTKNSKARYRHIRILARALFQLCYKPFLTQNSKTLNLKFGPVTYKLRAQTRGLRIIASKFISMEKKVRTLDLQSWVGGMLLAQLLKLEGLKGQTASSFVGKGKLIQRRAA